MAQTFAFWKTDILALMLIFIMNGCILVKMQYTHRKK